MPTRLADAPEWHLGPEVFYEQDAMLADDLREGLPFVIANKIYNNIDRHEEFLQRHPRRYRRRWPCRNRYWDA